jgi:hypothetical protein
MGKKYEIDFLFSLVKQAGPKRFGLALPHPKGLAMP